MKLFALPVLGFAAAFLFFATVSEGQTPNSSIVPIVNCYNVNEESGFLTAQFGYYNPGLDSKTILTGMENFISPFPTAQGQPTEFLPGRHDFVFQAVNVLGPEDVPWRLRWTLDGSDAMVDAATADELGLPDCETFGYGAELSGPPGPTGPTGPAGPAGPAGAGFSGTQVITGQSQDVIGTTTVEVECPAGSLLLGGGAEVEGSGVLRSSFPASETTWMVVVAAGEASSSGSRWFSRSAQAAAAKVTPYAICTAEL